MSQVIKVATADWTLLTLFLFDIYWTMVQLQSGKLFETLHAENTKLT